jgi:hypothetical protein
MAEFENRVLQLQASGITVDLLCAQISNSIAYVGVRLRPFAKKLPREKMVMATGATFEDALTVALGKAEDGRWENLDWSARPWDSSEAGGAAHRYGL